MLYAQYFQRLVSMGPNAAHPWIQLLETQATALGTFGLATVSHNYQYPYPHCSHTRSSSKLATSHAFFLETPKSNIHTFPLRHDG